MYTTNSFQSTSSSYGHIDPDTDRWALPTEIGTNQDNSRSKASGDPSLVWHYAPAIYLPRIANSGALIGSNALAPTEAKMLWFSANQRWEPTATKVLKNDAGHLVFLSLRQHLDSLGCIRFGLAADDLRLLNWRAACTFAGTPRHQRKRLEKAGEKQGANSKEWFATSTGIPLSELVFEMWLGEWANVGSAQEFAASLNHLNMDAPSLTHGYEFRKMLLAA